MSVRRYLNNPVVNINVHSPIPKSTFPQLSLATQRQLNVAAKNKKDQRKLVWCSYDAPGLSSDIAANDIGILIRKLFLAFNPRSEVQLLEDVLSHDCNFQDLNFRTPVVGEQVCSFQLHLFSK